MRDALRRGRAAGPVVPHARGAHRECAVAFERLALRELTLAAALLIRGLASHCDDARASRRRRRTLNREGRVSQPEHHVAPDAHHPLAIAPRRDEHAPSFDARSSIGEDHLAVTSDVELEPVVGANDRAPLRRGANVTRDLDASGANHGASDRSADELDARVQRLDRRAGGRTRAELLRSTRARREEQRDGDPSDAIHRALLAATGATASTLVGARAVSDPSRASNANRV